MAIAQKLSAHPVPEKVWEEYWEDQTINDRGILIDIPMVENAINLDKVSKSHLKEEMQSLSGLRNPQSVIQMQQWLKENGVELDSLGKKEIEAELEDIPEPMRSVLLLRQQLAMSAVKKYQAMDTAACSDGRCRGMFRFYGANRSGRFCLAEGTPILVKTAQGEILDKPIEDVLLSDLVYDGNEWVHHDGVVYSGEKDVITWDGITATAEHKVFITEDEKISLGEAKKKSLPIWRGQSQNKPEVVPPEAGHTRTYDILNAGPRNRFTANGRVVSNSGAIVQLQNLFRNSLPDLDSARALVKQGNYDALSLLYDSIPEVLAQCVRTAFIPAPGYKFIVADFSAIEARVLAWLAGEQWVLDVFASGGDIYCETASRMFGVPVVKHGINGDLRQKGKQATLSCGYGGGVGALKAMGAIEAGMKEEELGPLVDAWRASNPNIVKLWYAVDRAAKTAIKEKTTINTHGLEFKYRGGMLYITLPSGRHLSYVRPRIGENRYGGESVTYMGTDFTKHWARIETFGGKLVENCLSEGTPVLTNKGLVPIEKITPDHLIWDGEEFVKHDGLLYQGMKEVISVNGIQMTPDHKILTTEGWHRSGVSEGLTWAYTNIKVATSPCSEEKKVYDILNCGPRHRFAVWNGEAFLIVSNCVQAISRDILCSALDHLSPYRVVAHVHDECIVEVPPSTTVEEISSLMSIVPEWAPGLVLRADGYECPGYYLKD